MNIQSKKIFLVSRCAWTLYNFRKGLMRELVRKGHAVFGGGDGEDGFVKHIEEIGVPFKSLPVDKRGLNPIQDLCLLLALFKWYKREKPDIVHHFTIKPVIYGSIAARLAAVPKVVNTVTGLGYVFIEKNAAWLKWIVEHFYRFALKRVDTTFFQNCDDLNLFLNRNLVALEKTELLPGSGVDCRHFSVSNPPPQIHNGAKTFLMVSRLLKDKGVYEFAAAAKTIKSRFPECRFQLLGRRDVRNPNVVPENDIIRWTNDGILQWLGEVDEVRPIVGSADVIVLPSYREGTPKALLEAAAMGKPIVATDVAGCREVVEHGLNGLLVPMKNSNALADAMIEIITDPELAIRMGREGRQKIEREFDERIVIRKTLSKYF